MLNKDICKSILAGVIIVGMGACVPVGDLQEETRTIEMTDVTEAEVTLDMAAGEIRVQGGTRDLMEAIFTYNVEKWKPEVDYYSSGEKGYLQVKQGSMKAIPAGDGRNNWDVYLNEELPLTLIVDFGAGEGRLDLRDIQLKSLRIDMGVGDLNVDISGNYREDLRVVIDGGVGSATVYLPEDIGVKVNIDKGIGSVDARGFIKRGSVFTNAAYDRSDVSINVDIDAGIGSIDLRMK